MKKISKIICVILVLLLLCSCAKQNDNTSEASTTAETTAFTPQENEAEPQTIPEAEPQTTATRENETIKWDDSWQYAEFSKIHTDFATLYRSKSSELKNKVICINAGHGTKGGYNVKTQCHPDGSAKVTGGSTAKGETTAYAVAGGTSLLDGTEEADATLSLALVTRDKLLEAGYDVLMVREDDDAQLDNIARTVMANENSDCHIALHYDSTESDKGLFYIGVPDVKSYKAMEPVASHYTEHKALGEAIVKSEREAGIKIFSDGYMNLDLTQTSYSTVPSIDLEVGDRASDHSDEQLTKIANAIVNGLNEYYA